MNGTVLMIAFVLGVIIWLMVLTGIADKAKNEAKNADKVAYKVQEMLKAYENKVGDAMDLTKRVNDNTTALIRHDKKLINDVALLIKKVKETQESSAELSATAKALIIQYQSEHKEESNDRESDEEDGDDLEGGDPETVSQGSP